MIRYLYKAKNEKGKIVTGTVKANNEIEAEKILGDHNLSAVDMSPLKQSKIAPHFGGKVNAKDRAIFARQLSTMISAGLPLPKALKIISAQTQKVHIRDVYLDVYSDLEEGYSFSSALAKHSNVFDRVFVSIVAAGETTGKLDIVLDQLATQLENDSNFIEYICFYISINIMPIIPRTMPILFVKDKSSLKIKLINKIKNYDSIFIQSKKREGQDRYWHSESQ